MSLAKLIKRKRNEAGLTQKQLATALHYDTAHIVSNWERGMSKPPLGTIARLSQLLALNTDDLEVLLEAYVHEPAHRRKMQVIDAFVDGQIDIIQGGRG